MANNASKKGLGQIIAGIVVLILEGLVKFVMTISFIPIVALKGIPSAKTTPGSARDRDYWNISSDHLQHMDLSDDATLPGEHAAGPQTRDLVSDILDAFADAELLLDPDQDVRDLAVALGQGSKDIREQFERFHSRAGNPFSEGDVICKSELESGLLGIQEIIFELLRRLANKQISLMNPVPLGTHLAWIWRDARPWVGFCIEAFRIWFLYSLGTVATAHIKSLIRSQWLFSNHLEERQNEINRLKAEILDLIKIASGSTVLSLTKLSQRVEWATEFRTLPPLSQPSQTSLALSKSRSSTTSLGRRELFLKQKTSEPKLRKGQQLFTHKSLHSPYSFRLIKLIGKSRKNGFEFRMKTFSIANAPDYYALSYCWGEPGRKQAIMCENQILEVSSGLGEALEQLYTPSASGTRWLWIDQICIDQKNLFERTEQVRIMKVIYQRATKVIIWLGPKDKHAEPALQVLREAVFPAESVGGSKPGGFKIRSIWESHKVDKRQSLYHFLSRPWFRRAWIIQEVVVPKNGIVILCGDIEIRWTKFLTAALTLLTNERYDRKLQEFLQPIQNIHNLAAEDGLWDLSSLLLMTRPARATDPRDKVFAFLGLCGETEQPDKWPGALRPDYSRSIKEVFRDATRYCIETSKSLSVLYALHHVVSQPIGKNLGLPSWVPRWDAEHSPIELSRYTMQRNEKGWKFRVEIGHNATGSLKAEMKKTEDEDTLILKGIKIDTIKHCMAPCSFSHLCASYAQPCSCAKTQNIDPGAQAILDLWASCVAHLHACSDIHTIAEFLFRASTAGQFSAADLALPVFWGYLFAVADHVPLKSRTKFNESLGDDLASLQVHKGKNWARFANTCKLSEDRRIFLTKSGRLGLGPVSMAEGDILCVLFGGVKPFVLRPSGDCWNMVGECYVDDLMDGSAVRDLEKPERDPEWFHIV